MTNARTGTLVLKDQTGNYFLVSQETLEQGRVPEEQKGEIERLVAEAAAPDDVSGHAIYALGRIEARFPRLSVEKELPNDQRAVVVGTW